MMWDEIAAQATVGLLVVHGGRVLHSNPAAVRLVEPYGGAWDGPVLDEVLLVAPGAGCTTLRWPSPTGRTRWWDVTCSRLADASLLYVIVDETTRYGPDAQALGPLTARWRLARLEAMTHSGSWVWCVDDGTVVMSDGHRALLGLPRGAALDFGSGRELVHPDDRELVDEVLALALRTRRPFSFAHRLRRADGRGERVLECVGEVFTDAAGVPHRVMGSSRDVTDAHRARQELAFLADRDPLTGIANRRRITGRLAECAAQPGGAALLLIDIDNFKDINDLRGHAVGDRVIREIARTVESRLRPGMLVGRLGGDEFAVIVPDVDATIALEMAEDLCDVVSNAPVVDRSDAIRVTISIGVAVVGGEVDPDSGLARADLALYEAKRAGRNRARLFTPGQYREAMRRVSVLQRVAAALDEGTMCLDAQPIVDLATGRTGRHELLIRLRDGLEPELGPAEFLPAAERTDLVLRIDRWVLSRAVDALASPRARAAALCFEVNVSARSLDDPELGGWILEQLKLAEVEPARLGLEITETAAISNLEAARCLARQLAEAGCGITLDDFGAGFASFSHLKHLPFTAVKIAGEFVRQADIEQVDRALITAVVGVARELGMRTVAEHVDRRPMVPHLRTLGVDDGQGYLLGRPRPLADLLAGP
jgi:diguanylate cyclase (GGDEF)-like protein/PAS domain S-box-containing protein